jgi:peptidoglycan/LPS O-acetylase OafA/YrhL
MSHSGSGRIIEIDTFRAWAILSVLFFHYFKEFFPGGGSFFRFGWSGVDLFFVISGFVLYLQVIRSYARGGKTDYARYLRNRALRIIPVYYASLFATVLLFGRDKLFTPGFLMHLSFLHIFDYKVAMSIQPLYWTLGVEAQFYLFLIVAAGIFSGRSGCVSLAVITALSLIYRYAVSAAFGFTDRGVLLMIQLPGRFPEFCCGIFLAKLYLGEDLWERMRGRMGRLGPLFLAGGILYIVLARLWLSGGDEIFNDVLISTVFHPLVGLSFSLMMLPLMALPEKMTSLMRLKPLVFVGLISYSIYVWHMFIIMFLNRYADLKDAAMRAGLKMLLALAATLVFSTLSYYLIERTFLRLKAGK